MTGVTPTAPPASAAAAAAGLAAAGRRAPDPSVRPDAPEPGDEPRRSPMRPDPATTQPDPDGHRGRLVDVYA